MMSPSPKEHQDRGPRAGARLVDVRRAAFGAKGRTAIGGEACVMLQGGSALVDIAKGERPSGCLQTVSSSGTTRGCV
jgi:hypothetical protein